MMPFPCVKVPKYLVSLTKGVQNCGVTGKSRVGKVYSYAIKIFKKNGFSLELQMKMLNFAP